MGIYLDNAATSFPKPQDVIEQMNYYFNNVGSNFGRGTYGSSLDGSRILYYTRESICRIFNFDKPSNVIFTSNITTSLNILLKSAVNDGDEVITTSMDHNSVLRPLKALEKEKNIKINILDCDEFGLLSLTLLENTINKNTKIVVMSISSNIVGTVQNIEKIGEICNKNNVFFILDSAQGAGYLDIDFYKMNLSALAFTGHKGLMGPQGTGGFIISDPLNDISSTFIEGGTGSLSDSLCQPTFLPDKFEAGTMNTIGIFGLKASLDFIEKVGVFDIREKEEFLSKLLIENLLNIPQITLYGPKDYKKITPVFSITSTFITPEELSYRLESDYGIITRCGLHCSPIAHKTIGTFPQGSVRLSIGYYNSISHINFTIDSINNILKGCD